MKFTDLFIKRPVVATVVNLIILIAGYQAIRSLNVRQYPRSDLSVITVTTTYYGADADLVRGFITTPLEQSIASADGIDYMESQSAQSTSTISVHLNLILISHNQVMLYGPEAFSWGSRLLRGRTAAATN